ncbi:phytanoyl-CoA dioxygenase family protein [Pollutibacter soli]|uniref:phytanoyl-CoA dioxygenase family protein n=1 Tax=Pollutibacter soli TaxID=3034157 RepID=UPI003013632F
MTTASTTTAEKAFTEELNAPFTITPEMVDFFSEYGYIKIKNVLSSPLLKFYGNVITSEVKRLNTLEKPMEERTTYEKAFLQIMNIWRENDTVKDFVFSKRLAKIAADLMQVNGVRLYHDQALYKEPSGGITPWHADQFYWPLDTPKTITAWIPFQDTPMEMGPLAFAEKSQSVEIGRDIEISDESENILQEELRKRNFNMNDTPFELGELSYHAGWLFHRAGPNKSTKPREVMTMIYMDKDIRIKKPSNSYQVNDWNSWCSGYPIGGVPEGPLNPVLYER